MVEAFSLENLPFEAYKASLDSSAIIGDRNADEYNTHGLAFINAVPDGKATTLDSRRDFIYNVVLENLVSNIHKGFATYFNPVYQLQLLLLDNRKIYSLDKTRNKTVESKCKKKEAFAKEIRSSNSFAVHFLRSQ